MRRVVITGMGIVSSIGNNTQEVLASLHEAKSGITRADKYAELGFRSQVQGAPTLDPAGVVDRRAMRFLGEGAAWNHVAMEQAIQDSGLEPAEVSNIRTGIIMGSGGPSARTIVEAADITRTKGPKRVGPFAVPKAMSSTASATLATWFKIKGVNYSISSACATSNHCIGNAYETIQIGKQDIIFAGGCEELDWSLSVLFDAMGAMSSKYNDTPATASRPYDVSRDGFVIAGGAGVVVLEELEHAKARGAQHLRRNRRLRRHLRRLRHGRPVGRGRRALHENGDGDGRYQDRLHQPARHLDAGGRSAGNRGDPQGVRHRRQVPADFSHQGADRTLARRHRRAGGDLFAADDATTASSAKAPTSPNSIRCSPTCRSCASASTTPSSEPCFRIPSALAAPTPRWCSSGWMREISLYATEPANSAVMARLRPAIHAGSAPGLRNIDWIAGRERGR